ncbi:TPA: hypothetical protein EYP38_05570, partial [Candidatus Micrarchaeota archaeon]|nr:hypothetical protein [Candidatus Micrarchaeota archaeon]
MRREPAPRKLPDIITTTAVAAVCATSIASAAGTFTNGWHRRFSRKLGVWQSFRKCSRGLYRYCKRERGRWHLARRVTGGMRHNAYAEEGKEIPDFDPLEHMVRQLPATVRAAMDAAPGGSMLILDLRGELPELEIMAPNSLALEHQQDAWHGHSSHEGMLPAEMSGWGMMEHESHVPFHEFSGHAETALTAHGLDAEMSPHCMHFHGHHEEHHHHHTHHDHVHAEEPHAFHVFFSTVLRIPGLDPYAVCTGGHHHGHHHHHASHHDHAHHSHHELHHHIHRHEHHWHGHHHVPHEHWHHSHHGYHEHGHHGHHHLHHHSRHSHHEHGHHAHHWHGHVHVPHGHQHIHHSHHGYHEHGHHGHHHLHH